MPPDARQAGNDISSLVRQVLETSSGGPPRTRMAEGIARRRAPRLQLSENSAFDRMFTSTLGQEAHRRIGNETETMRALSILSVELLYEYLSVHEHGFLSGARCLTVPGDANQNPVLLLLDPRVPRGHAAERITDDAAMSPGLLDELFRRDVEHSLHTIDSRLDAPYGEGSFDGSELLWITRPEIIRARMPEMVPLCSPVPHVRVECNGQFSSVGVFCRDSSGTLGVSACHHGTGDVGASVRVQGVARTVALADKVQDIVFIPLDPTTALPALYGIKGPRNNRAPSQAEPVAFDGAGSGMRVQTVVQSHDSGILRRRPTVQLKVQTPGVTNAGDSGCALVDGDDHVLGFGFEQSAYGEFPQLTDWIWADNALASLGLTPV